MGGSTRGLIAVDTREDAESAPSQQLNLNQYPAPATRWGLIVAGWSVYAIYYLGRVNFSIAVPGLGEEQDLDAIRVGALTAGVFPTMKSLLRPT